MSSEKLYSDSGAVGRIHSHNYGARPSLAACGLEARAPEETIIFPQPCSSLAIFMPRRGSGWMRRAVLLFMAIACLLACSATAWAEPSISVSDITIGPACEDDFIAGQIYAQAQPIYRQSDLPWRITVRSLNPNLGISYDGTYIKPLGDLMWKLSDDVTWTPVTQEEDEVDWGSDTGDGVIYIDFLVTLDWLKDIPGNYKAELVFKIESIG